MTDDPVGQNPENHDSTKSEEPSVEATDQSSFTPNHAGPGETPATTLLGDAKNTQSETAGSERQHREFSLSSQMFAAMGPVPNPILEKVTSSHIDKLLDNAEKANSREAEIFLAGIKDSQHSRLVTWVGLAFIVLILGGLWFVVPVGKLASLKDIIVSLISLGAVAFGGYGYAQSKIREKE